MPETENGGIPVATIHLYQETDQLWTAMFRWRDAPDSFAAKGCSIADAVAQLINAYMQHKEVVIAGPNAARVLSESEANSRQVGGSHYRAAIQHWDWAISNSLGYMEGQITKYVARWRKKNGVQDLEKAEHFLQKLLEVARSEAAEKVSGAGGSCDTLNKL